MLAPMPDITLLLLAPPLNTTNDTNTSASAGTSAGTSAGVGTSARTATGTSATRLGCLPSRGAGGRDAL
jgi:hypothetical protein